MDRERESERGKGRESVGSERERERRERERERERKSPLAKRVLSKMKPNLGQKPVLVESPPGNIKMLKIWLRFLFCTTKEINVVKLNHAASHSCQ